MRPLLIPFRPDVGLAEHLAVLDVGSAALAPRRHVVGVHFREFPHAGGVSVVAEGAEQAVGCALCLRLLRLAGIDRALRGLVEHAHVQERRVLFAAEQVHVHAPAVLHER